MSGRLTLRTAVPLLMFLAVQNSYGQEGLKWHDLKPGMSEESVLSGLRQNYEVTQLGTMDDLRSWLVIDKVQVRVVGKIHFIRGKLATVVEQLAEVNGNKEAMDFVRKLYRALCRDATPVLGTRSCMASLLLVPDPSGMGDSLQIYIDSVPLLKSRVLISLTRLEKFGESIRLESILREPLESTDKSPSKPK